MSAAVVAEGGACLRALVHLPQLFEHLRTTGYHRNYVLELEGWNEETTLRWLTDARRYVAEAIGES